MRTVLVLGATGFVGSHALEAISADGGLDVIAACRDRERLPQGFNGRVRLGDLRDERYLEWLFEGVDVVCNAFAWTSLFDHAAASESLFLAPSLRLIEAAAAAGVRRLVNVSTTSAAAPERSVDPMSHGIPRGYWPHLCNVIRIEDALRTRASAAFGVVNLRLGLFAGRRYALGLLPILLPRLRTHLVPWVAGGRTGMPIVDGRDIGQALYRAVVANNLIGYQSFNIVGPSVPSVRQVLDFLHHRGHPRPHFSVPFPAAFAFAWLMELIDPVAPWEPLVTRSIVHLLRDTHADNARAQALLGYRPCIDWREAIEVQLAEMRHRRHGPMSMARPIRP